MSPRALATIACLLAVVLVVSACSDKTPTGPSAKAPVSLMVQMEPGFVTGGELYIDSSTCSCTTKPVAVSVNGMAVGTIGCGGAASFAIPTDTSQFRVLMTSPDIQPVDQTFGIAVVGSTPGFSLSVRCAAP